MIGLQNYTTYSILSGLFEVEEWLDNAKKKGYTALAITDKHTVSGHYKLQKFADKAGIKPIFGLEVEVYSDNEVKADRVSLGYALLYAKDEVGYKNLLNINYFSSLRTKLGDFYNRQKISLSRLLKHSEGLVCIVPSIDGAGLALKKDFVFENQLFMNTLSSYFKDDFYIGINPMYKDPSNMVANLACSYLEFKKVFVYGSYYHEEEQSYLYDVVRSFDKTGSSRFLSNNDRVVERGFLPRLCDLNFIFDGEEYLSEDIRKACLEHQEEVVSKCNFRFDTSQVHIPKPDVTLGVMEDLERKTVNFFKTRFRLPEFNSWEELFNLKLTGLDEIYVKRFEREVKTIEKINTRFFDYFHIINKLCEKHDEKFGCRGPARGSAGGSLFAYALNIVKIDPVYWDLSFERFLDETRSDYPDIDLDFSTEGRDYVIGDYFANQYGNDSIVSVVAFKRLKIKSGIDKYRSSFGGFLDNEGNAISYSPKYIDEILNMHVPATLRGEKELNYMVENSSSFREFYNRHSDFFRNVLLPLQETVLNTSLHASATIVTNGPAKDCFGVSWSESKQTLYSELEFEDLEKLGYLKFDLLVVNAVSVVNRTQELIRMSHPNVVFPEFDKLNFQDPKVLDIFSEGNTGGIFQFHSYLQRNFLKQLKPKHFEALPICVAILRTGPMSANAHNIFLETYSGQRPEIYENATMENILKPTYSLLVYQEQVMRIGVEIAGMTPVQSNQLRRVLAKKKVDEVEAWRDIFVDGALANGHDPKFVNDLFEKIAFFSEYSFNVSHSLGYSVMAFYQAWLKAYYPVEFWAAVLDSAKVTTSGDTDVFTLKYEAENDGIKFIYPTIKGFSDRFMPAGNNRVYWPLSKIKGMGAAATFLSEHGTKFDDLDEFLVYCNERNEQGRRPINVSHVKTLLDIGFFKPIGTVYDVARQIYQKRDDLAHESKIETYREKHYQKRVELLKSAETNPSVLEDNRTKRYLKEFDPSSVNRNKPEELPFEYQNDQGFIYWANLRNKAFGFEVSKWKDVADFSDFVQEFSEKDFHALEDGEIVFIAGKVTKIYLSETKSGRAKGKYHALVYIEDGDEKYAVRFWGEMWENELLARSGQRPNKGDLVEMEVKKNIWNDRHQFVIDAPYPESHLRVVWRNE